MLFKHLTIRLISIIFNNDDKIEILSDELKEGDQLVVVGQARLVDGVKVNVYNIGITDIAFVF